MEELDNAYEAAYVYYLDGYVGYDHVDEGPSRQTVRHGGIG